MYSPNASIGRRLAEADLAARFRPRRYFTVPVSTIGRVGDPGVVVCDWVSQNYALLTPEWHRVVNLFETDSTLGENLRRLLPRWPTDRALREFSSLVEGGIFVEVEEGDEAAIRDASLESFVGACTATQL